MKKFLLLLVCSVSFVHSMEKKSQKKLTQEYIDMKERYYNEKLLVQKAQLCLNILDSNKFSINDTPKAKARGFLEAYTSINYLNTRSYKK